MKRSDGREADELRPIEMIPHYVPYAEGSVLIRFGETNVLCAATAENTTPSFLEGTNSGWVTAEYSMLPCSCRKRVPRESRLTIPRGRSQEIQRLIGRSLRSTVDLNVLGPRTIRLDCDVIVADGGTRTASICGGYAALYLAFNKLIEKGTIEKLPFTEQIAAVSVGIVDGEVLLDLSYEEDSRASVDMNIVMTENKHIVEIQGTAEGNPFTQSELAAMLEMGSSGIELIIKKQKEILDMETGA